MHVWQYNQAPEFSTRDRVPDISNQGFRREEKLLSADDFSAAFRDGKRQHTPLLIMIRRQNQGNVPRLGLAIAKKNVRHAVDRNRIKRIIREWFRMNKLVLAGHDYVVIAKPGAASSENRDITSALQQAIGKFG